MRPGDVVERYTVETLLGEGATAAVWRVRHTALGTVHALKVLHTADPELADRLLAEGRLQATLDHPNLVPVTDVFAVDGRPALLMACVDGPDLGRFLQSVSPEPGEAEALFHGIVAGVACAYARGIVHRDLKPGNVLLETVGGRPCPRVTDFGIARLLSETGPRTESGRLVGTLPYLAPELLDGSSRADPRADVWALGVVLYELVCGSRPFDGDSAAELREAIGRGPVPAARVVPDLPPALGRALAGCLVADPAARIPDAEILRAVLDGQPWTPTAGSGADGRRLGDFELLDEIGRGAVGVVYRARQLGLDRIVALKVIRRRVPFDLVAEARFLREIRALARVSHPNVVSVLAHGQTDSELFFAMDHVQGENLARIGDVLSEWRTAGPVTGDHLGDAARGEPRPGPRRGSALPLPLHLARLFADVADGLHALHEAGVVHRDVKPSNLVLSADGDRIRVTDLGLAQLSDTPTLTVATVRILGTLRYMPPEQLQHQLVELDGRVDVYALGATLTELCTGVPFLDGDTEQRLIHQLLNEDPPSARDLDPTVPTALDLVLRKATAKRAADRYPTARALAADLRAVSRGEPPSVRPPGLPARLWTWVGRNTVATAVVLTGLASLLSGSALVTAGVAGVAYRTRAFEKNYVDLIPRYGGYAGNRWMSTWLPTLEDHVAVRSRGGRPVRLELRGADGAYRSGRPPILEQVFDADGRVVQIVHRDPSEAVASVESVLWDTDDQGRPRARRRWATPAGVPMADPVTGAPCIEEILDDAGFPTIRRMRDADGLAPRPNDEGTFEVRSRRDAWGRLVERAWFDPAGAPSPNAAGYAIERHRWPPGAPWHTQKSDTSLFDTEGRPTHDRAGVHRTEHPYPDLSTILFTSRLLSEPIRFGVAWFGVDGEPVLGPDGFARETTDLYVTGRYRSAWFGPDGAPMPGPEGAPARERVSPSMFASPHDPGETRWLGTDGELRVTDHGIAEEERSADGDERLTRFFGPDGAPIARADWAFAIRERPGELACLGADGALAFCRDGWAQRTVEKGAYGWWTAARYTDPAGLPVKSREHGAAVVLSPRDGAGRILEHRYIGPDGALVPHPGSGGRDLHAYDVSGRLVSRTVVDAEGRPATAPEGWHREITVRDGWGNEIEQRYEDMDGLPVVASDTGWAVQRQTRDRFGQPIAAASFGADGLPILADGCAVRTTARDPWGHVVEERCTGVDGGPAPGLDGAPRRVREVDAGGRLLRESWTDLDGRPASGRGGASSVRTERDGLGRVVRTSTFGPDGALREGPDGFAVVEEDVDRDGRVLERRSTAAGGPATPAVSTFIHDVQHRVIEEQQLDGERNLLRRVARSYDPRGLLVREATTDAAGAPVAGTDGSAVHEIDHDPRGDIVEERWLGPDLALLRRGEGP